MAQARNPYSLSWLWIPGSRFARPGMTPFVSGIHALEPVGRGDAELGKTCPEPIIEHRLGRERALKACAKIRAT